MLQFLLKFNLITPDQHGFLPGKSTETTLYEFNNYIYENLDKGKLVAVLFSDLSKTFYSLDINYICIKLEALGFRGTFLAFLKSKNTCKY